MKKRLFTSLLALLMLLPLLAIAPTAGADAPPETYTIRCKVCQRDTLGRFARYSSLGGDGHYPVYRCTVCLEGLTFAPLYEKHTGGTATCTKRAVCYACNSEYGDLLDHDWAFSANNDQTHGRTCQRDGCGYSETVSCTLDSANCVRGAQCSDCKAVYGELDPNNHNWGYWTCNGDMTHSRVCNLDSSHTETESCSLREANCTYPARCEVCGGRYGDINPNKHLPRTPYSNGDGTHTIKCDYTINTSHDTIERCYGGDATCQQKGKCSACGGEYYADHVFTKWVSDSDYHFQPCDVCYGYGNGAFQNLGSHYDDNRDHQCDACGMEMSKCSLEAHAEEKYLASPATCVSKAQYYLHCNYCDQVSSSTFEGDVDPDNHDLAHHEGKAATCTEIGWAAYDTCKREGCNYTSYKEIPALNHDLVHHDAKAPTCTEIGWEAYDTCSRCDYTTYEELPASSDNHDLSHVKAKAPTCTDHGWEAYDVCKRCGYNTLKELPALGHWYGEWMPNGSHTHLASCKRGFGHRAATTCAALDYTLPTEGADAYEFTLCPVCGEVNDGTQLELIGQTTAQPITRWLPAGEQVLRLGTLENGELILTAAFEISGQLTQPTGQIQFTLPAKHLEGFTLTILHPDGTEEPLDCTVEKDKATFTLDFTNQKTPAMTLRLTPEA